MRCAMAQETKAPARSRKRQATKDQLGDDHEHDSPVAKRPRKGPLKARAVVVVDGNKDESPECGSLNTQSAVRDSGDEPPCGSETKLGKRAASSGGCITEHDSTQSKLEPAAKKARVAKKQPTAKPAVSKKRPLESIAIQSSPLVGAPLVAPPDDRPDFERLIQEKIQQIEKQRQNVETLKEERDKCRQKLLRLTHPCFSRQRKDLQERIQTYEEHIQNIEQGKYLRKFQENTLPFLQSFQKVTQRSDKYYTTEPSPPPAHSALRHPPPKYCAAPLVDPQKGKPKDAPKPAAGAKKPKGHAAIDYIEDGEEPSEQKIVQNWMNAINKNAPSMVISMVDKCPECDVEMVVCNESAMTKCPCCGLSERRLDATLSSVAYGDDIDFASFNYKKQQHARECINAVQAKDPEISLEVLEFIMWSLYLDQGLRSIDEIEPEHICKALKQYKLNNYYERFPQIFCRVAGRDPPRFTPEEEETCMTMFAAVQKPYEQHKCPGRVNFFSYPFCLWMFCVIKGYWRFLDCFKLLKGPEHLMAQEEVFRKVCLDLDWEFRPVSETMKIIQAAKKEADKQKKLQQQQQQQQHAGALVRSPEPDLPVSNLACSPKKEQFHQSLSPIMVPSPQASSCPLIAASPPMGIPVM